MDDAVTCTGIRPALGVYLTGAIAPADRVVVVRHLAACADCRAELAGLAGLPALLRRPPVQAAAAQEPPTDHPMPDYTVPYYPATDYPATDYPATDYPDAGYPDAGYPDAGYPDAGYPDAGEAGGGDPGAGRMPERLVRRAARRRRRRAWLLAAGAFVLVVAAATGWALHLMGPPGPDTDATVLHTRTIGDVTVLTDAEGYTLYWFGPDSGRRSACQASCAQNWPPVTGPAAWGPAVTGTIGAIVRPDGLLQATYDGHPLYTTTADTGPGQTKGNGVWSHGGEWHEVTVPSRAG